MQFEQGVRLVGRFVTGLPKGSLVKLTRNARSDMNKLSDFHLFVLEKGQMACADLRKCYGDYFDRELPATVRGKLDSHIEECPRCQEFTASYRFTVELAATLGKKPIPTDVQRRLRATLNARLGISLPIAE